MSVPPEIDDRHRSCLMSRYTYSEFSGSSGEPVEVIMRSLPSLYLARGLTPNFSAADRYLALVPKMLRPSSSAMRHRMSCVGWNGEPSYSSSVAPTARLDTSQFHIIQPQVVK